MSKKRRNTPVEKDEEPLGENWVTPFANLNIKIEEPPPPPPPPPPTKHEIVRETLSKEDRALLQAFGGEDPESPSLDRSNMKKKIERLTLSKEKKGHGGKIVTLVHGLESMDTLKQMELCAKIKTSLGIGGRFVEGVLELQGDQRDRAGAWFEKENYHVRLV